MKGRVADKDDAKGEEEGVVEVLEDEAGGRGYRNRHCELGGLT